MSFLRIFSLLICLQLAQVTNAAVETPPSATPSGHSTDKVLLTQETIKTNALNQLSPGEDDAPIARLTARVLQQFQYRHQVFNDTVASNFLARFIGDLDPQHIHFLQSDVDGFARYRTTLDDLTVRFGDTAPAYEIFSRFLQRLTERTAYAEAALKTEQFQFDTDERITVNRHTLPYPKDIAEARKFWRERVRFEYLQEKLNAENPATTNALHVEVATNTAAKGEKVELECKFNDITALRPQIKKNRADINIARRIARAAEGLPASSELKGGQQQLRGLVVSTPRLGRKNLNAQANTNERVRLECLQEKLNAVNPAKTNEPQIGVATNKLNETTWAAGYAAAETNNSISNAAAKPALPKTPTQIHDDIVKTLVKRYDRILKLFREKDRGDVLEIYLTTLAHVYDPHSDYFGKSSLEEFSMGMNLSLFGIGAVLQSDEDGYCKIKELKPGPALKGGQIKPNDRIVAVAQGTNEPVDVVNMPLNKVVQFIRGPKGSEVRLTLIPANATDPAIRKVVPIIRDEIKLEDSAAKAKLVELPDGKGGKLRLGVIDLPSFYATMDVQSLKDKSTLRSTTADVTKLLVKLAEEKVGGVILDLRRNGGGSLEEAIRLTGLFIKRGPVVQVRDPNGEVMVKEDEDPSELYDGPLIVLTSRFSASASEIVAGALQDYGRALIVGDTTTHGKGTVQTLTQLAPYLRGSLWTTNDPGALKVTISKFYRPSGSSTQLKGVASDIVLPSIDNVAEIGETALDGPLPWDTIASSDFDHMNRVSPFLEELRRRSAQRVASEKDFDYVREDVTIFQKAQADKTVSLNETQRLKETQEAEARKKTRDAELAARKEAAHKVYEISLKQADIPGLPAPVSKTNAVTTAESDKPDDVTDAKSPAVDVNLEEAEHILVDYLGLLPTTAVAAVKR